MTDGKEIDNVERWDCLPTVLDFACHINPDLRKKERLNGEDFADLNLPFWGGCAICEASIAAYNACFGRHGYLIGTCCADKENALTNMLEIQADRAKAENKENGIDYEDHDYFA
jgi:hypothetical protein|tara:strand:- start:20 stop:361 length:342 start_codon:yes stop_codon:yes gene_type:complete